MFALTVARLVEEFEDICDVLSERCQAVLVCYVTKDADLRYAVLETKRIRCIGHCNGSDCGYECNASEHQSQPAAPQGSPPARGVGDDPVEHVQSHRRQGQASAQVSVDGQAHQ